MTTQASPRPEVKDLTDAELDKLREQVGKFTVEGDLRREVTMSIKRLIDLGCYRGPAIAIAGPRPHAHQRPHRKGPRKAIAGKKAKG